LRESAFGRENGKDEIGDDQRAAHGCCPVAALPSAARPFSNPPEIPSFSCPVSSWASRNLRRNGGVAGEAATAQ
jgi:hypothetical protein